MKTAKHRTVPKELLGIATLLVASTLATTVRAQTDPATSSLDYVIPYDGRLEMDGVAMDGRVEMMFELRYGDMTWSESWTDDDAVVVTDGEFSVLLGRHTAVPNVFFSAEEAELVVFVLREECGDVCGEVAYELLPHQVITPVPYALWTARAYDFAADQLTAMGDLRNDRGISIQGDIHIASSEDTGGNLTAAQVIPTSQITAQQFQATGGLSARALIANSDLTVDGDTLLRGDETLMTRTADNTITVNSLFGIANAVYFEDTVTIDGRTMTPDTDEYRPVFAPGAMEGRGADGTLNWRIDTNMDMFRIEHFTISGNTTINIDSGVRASNWVCVLAGFDVEGADPCEHSAGTCLTCELDDNDDGTWDRPNVSGWTKPDCNESTGRTWELGIFRAYTYPRPDDGNWRIVADFLTELDGGGGDDEFDVLLLCMPRRVSAIYCPGTNDLWTSESGDCTSDPWHGWINAPRSWPPP